MPLISVIIPTHNRAQLVCRTIESVLAQSFTDYEIVVCDDGSTDDTQARLAAYGNRLKVVRGRCRGPGAARNSAMEVASGQYVAFLDSDDLWLPWTLETVARALRAESQPRCVCHNIVRFKHEASTGNESPLLLLAAASDELRPEDATAADLKIYPDIAAAMEEQLLSTPEIAALLLQDVRHVGGFVEGALNMEDVDLVLRLGHLGPVAKILSPATVLYRVHPDSISHDPARYLASASLLINNEVAGRYPAGTSGIAQRRATVLRLVRKGMAGGPMSCINLWLRSMRLAFSVECLWPFLMITVVVVKRSSIFVKRALLREEIAC